MRTRTAATGMIGAILLCAAGCSTAKVTHTLDSNDSVDVPDFSCFLVAGASISGGATTSYSVHGSSGGYPNNMEAAVVDSSFACPPTSVNIAFGTGIGSITASGFVPATSNYNLAIYCSNPLGNNGAAGPDCLPTIDYWTWDD